MNNTFDLRRFGHLLNKTIYEKRLALLGSFVLLIALSILIYATGSNARNSTGIQRMVLFFGILVMPTVVVNILLDNFSKKSVAASFLTLPCSYFEKWLVVLVFTALVYLPLFILSFKILDVIFVNHYRDLAVTKWLWNTRQIENELPYFSLSFDKPESPLAYLLSNFFMLSAVSMIGSLYFNQKSYIKTTLVGIAIFIIIHLLASKGMELIIGEKVSIKSLEFTGATVTNEALRMFPVTATEPIKSLLNYFILLVLPATLWLIGLVRFREKEL